MPRFLIAIHHPDDFDPTSEGPEVHRAIDLVNEEMIAKGIRLYADGLRPAKGSKSIRRQGGKLVVTDGPYLETKEHMGGFWIVEAKDMDEALEWGRKGAEACRTNVEVREFYSPKQD